MFRFSFFDLSLSRKTVTLSIALFFALALLAVAFGLTFSPSNHINVVENSYDVRLSGLTEQGWSTPNFSFTENKILAASTKLKIVFREQAAGAKATPTMQFSQNNTVLTEGAASGPLFFKLPKPKSFTDNLAINFSAKSLNPFQSGSDHNRFLGAKVATITIAPRFLLLLPSLSFGLWPVFLIAILLLLLTVFYKKKQ